LCSMYTTKVLGLACIVIIIVTEVYLLVTSHNCYQAVTLYCSRGL